MSDDRDWLAWLGKRALILWCVAGLVCMGIDIYWALFPPKPHVVRLADVHVRLHPALSDSDSIWWTVDTTSAFPLDR